ncbi:hypothetical protein L1049_014177 [Liquidambar formosana]|uniref:Uncharacterized protein n=1 Tax=Liquidambar formosana TaxID=63359 RepID=A0AAP0RMM5_LIQFO
MGLRRYRWGWIGALRRGNGLGGTLFGHMILTRDGVTVSQFLLGLSFQNQEIQIP